MLGYSAKHYGCRGLTLHKCWDSPCPAMETSRKTRAVFFFLFLVLEALGPDSGWKPQLSWRWAMCSSGSVWKNSGWLIHNSSGVPGNVRTEEGSLALPQGRGLLPQQDVGNNQPSFTQVTSQSTGLLPGRLTASARDWSPCSAQGRRPQPWETYWLDLYDAAAVGKGQCKSWPHPLG